MSRAFTWWRRFYAPIKLPKQYYFKGLSPLLQRIEAGDFEFNHLHLECKLEEAVYESELQEVRSTTDQLHEELAKANLSELAVAHDSSARLGHSGP